MPGVFNFANSDHPAEPAASAVAPQEQPGPRTFSYPVMHEQQNPPKGADQVPDNMRKLRGDARGILYPHSHDSALPFPDGATAEERATIVELRSIMQDIGASGADVAVFAEMLAQDPAPPEERAAWETEAREALRAEYGTGGTNQALAGAQALAQRDPRFLKFLEDSGLGSHPKIVAILAARARSEKLRGRL